MTLIGILAILLMASTISSQSYVKKASAQVEANKEVEGTKVKQQQEFGNEKVEQARTAPTNNTLTWFDKELEKPTASEAEKPKSTAEKPEAAAQVEAKDLFHKEVEGTIKQGQQLGNSQIKVQNQQIDTGTLHTKESARELAMASQAVVHQHGKRISTGAAGPTSTTASDTETTNALGKGITMPFEKGYEGEQMPCEKGGSCLKIPIKGPGSTGGCPAGEVRDWAGICFNKYEAKACLTCAPGSAGRALVEYERMQASAKAVDLRLVGGARLPYTPDKPQEWERQCTSWTGDASKCAKVASANAEFNARIRSLPYTPDKPQEWERQCTLSTGEASACAKYAQYAAKFGEKAEDIYRHNALNFYKGFVVPDAETSHKEQLLAQQLANK